MVFRGECPNLLHNLGATNWKKRRKLLRRQLFASYCRMLRASIGYRGQRDKEGGGGGGST